MMHETENTTPVVSLNEYRVMAQHPALAQIDAYWEALRGGRTVPLRSDVDPRGIDKALEYAFVLERIAPGVARFRLAGMHLNDLMGMEVRGMPLSAFFATDARNQINDLLEHVFEEPAKARLYLGAEDGLGRPPMTAELLLLPLRSDLGDTSRALGCLVASGDIGQAPRRFELRDIAMERLGEPAKEKAVTNQAPIQPGPALDPVEGFAESAPSYAGEKAARKGERPYLRLIKSDD